jgi:hypothetical protein
VEVGEADDRRPSRRDGLRPGRLATRHGLRGPAGAGGACQPGTAIGIYGPERRIIDAFRLRHREGTDLASGALRRWLCSPAITRRSFWISLSAAPRSRTPYGRSAVAGMHYQFAMKLFGKDRYRIVGTEMRDTLAGSTFARTKKPPDPGAGGWLRHHDVSRVACPSPCSVAATSRFP